MSYLGWRWTQWLLLILGMAFVLLYFFTVPETYSPVLLSHRAKKSSSESRNGAIQAEANKKQIDLKDLARRYVLKPWIMIAQEPILALITLHMGFVFAFLYLCFEAYPITFEQDRGWNIGVGALPFLAVTVGVLMGVAIIIFHTKTRMQGKLHMYGEAPEERLVPMMLGSVLLPMGMFWFGCESRTLKLPCAWFVALSDTIIRDIQPTYHLGAPSDFRRLHRLWNHINFLAGNLLAYYTRNIACPLVCGDILRDTARTKFCSLEADISSCYQGLNYLLDVYKIHANSAISINAMFRGALAAGFPMFAPYMVKAPSYGDIDY